MGQRREVAGRPERAEFIDDRPDAEVVKIDEPLDDVGAHARMAIAQAPYFQKKDQPDDVDRDEVAHAGRVAFDEVFLQIGQLVGRDFDRNERSEARVYSIKRLFGGGEFFVQIGPAMLDAAAGCGGKLDFFARLEVVGDVGEGELVVWFDLMHGSKYFGWLNFRVQKT